jgi:hypothetical protein
MTGRVLDHAFLDEFEQRFGPVARTLGRLTRPAIIASKGRTLVWGDYSAIEARVLPWLAGGRSADKVLDVFRQNDKDPSLPDIYKIEAGNIFSKPPEEVEKGPERQTGKVAVLSLGFGGSDGALLAMATNYGLFLPPDLRKHIIDTWRDNNKWARAFWGYHNSNGSGGLWGAFNTALEHPGTICPAGRVAYTYDPGYHGGTIFCGLPCGRVLTYPSVKVRDLEFDNDAGEKETRRTLSFRKGYGFSGLWYGKLAENVTQAFAASLLRKALTRLVKLSREDDDYKWMIVMAHTHDEIVLHVPETHVGEARAVLEREMMRELPFMEGLPLAVELTENWYYSKATGA